MKAVAFVAIVIELDAPGDWQKANTLLTGQRTIDPKRSTPARQLFHSTERVFECSDNIRLKRRDPQRWNLAIQVQRELFKRVSARHEYVTDILVSPEKTTQTGEVIGLLKEPFRKLFRCQSGGHEGKFLNQQEIQECGRRAELAPARFYGAFAPL